ALEPRVILLVHDVAIHACAGIRRKIREALRVDEGERADTDRNPQQANKRDDKRRPCHRTPFTGKADPRRPARGRAPDRAARPLTGWPGSPSMLTTVPAFVETTWPQPTPQKGQTVVVGVEPRVSSCGTAGPQPA